VRHEQIRARGGGAQFRVGLAQLRHQQLTDDDLAASARVHDALEQLACIRRVRIDVGAADRKLDTCALDDFSIAFDRGQHGPMAAAFEREREPDVRKEIAVRSPARDDDDAFRHRKRRQPPKA
jgi:hypothetical protein